MGIITIGGITFLLNPYLIPVLAILAFFGFLPRVFFFCLLVLLHELGHVFAATSFGLHVKEVELLPFGGVARIDDLLEADPLVEACVALAGPLTSFFLAGLTYYLIQLETFPLDWLQLSLRANIGIGLFNLLPGLPLDGGRIYRAYLVKDHGYREATGKAATMGKALAVFLGLGGLGEFWFRGQYPSLLMVAFFLYFSADQEQGMAIYVLLRSLARKKQELQTKGVITAQQLVAKGDTPLKDVVKYFTPQKYSVLVILDEDGRLLGVVSEAQVLEGLLQTSIDTPLIRLLN